LYNCRKYFGYFDSLPYQNLAGAYLITFLLVCKYPTRKLVLSLPVRARTCLRASHRQARACPPSFYFPISPFGGIFDNFQAVNGYCFCNLKTTNNRGFHKTNMDGLVKSKKIPFSVIPAKAGIQ